MVTILAIILSDYSIVTLIDLWYVVTHYHINFLIGANI